jgi:hypothetical protein
VSDPAIGTLMMASQWREKMRAIIGMVLAVMFTTASYGYSDDRVVVGGFISEAGLLCPNLFTFEHLYHDAAYRDALADDVGNKARARSLGCKFLHTGTHIVIEHNRAVVGADGWLYYNVCFPGYACYYINALDVVVQQ